MKCPECSAEVPEQNRFCEECGKATGAAEQGCGKCGAPVDQIDGDGFCLACGFRRESRGRDHSERVLSPQFAGVTDRGIRHRRNEDSMGLEWIGDADTSVLVICDGVSSTTDADRASEVAVETAVRCLIGAALRGRDTHESAMEFAIAASQKAVAALGTASCSPATTIVCAIVQGRSAVIGWLGDSRAYWLSAGEVKQLTTDHSWMAEVVAAGEMTAEQATSHPSAHAITRWLGADAPRDSAIPIVRCELEGAGQLLLCSDGLWNYAPDTSAIAGLIRGPDAITTVRRMIDFANARGGQDNVTAVLLTRNPPNVSIQS